MARDSRKVRQLRRLKREKNVAYRMLNHVLGERNFLRQVLEKELADKLRPDLASAPPVVEGETIGYIDGQLEAAVEEAHDANRDGVEPVE